ncbi:hypothetical protein E2C01_026751 [Portunus trituberculatus]|uniref:Uncharacterized protein n=1 Tax=Portunus trituberculatus TaxID=210409 RepID=A0A5B7EGX9_PORTR|nr:hypothetical protein [Portunus trituberculatus]
MPSFQAPRRAAHRPQLRQGVDGRGVPGRSEVGDERAAVHSHYHQAEHPPPSCRYLPPTPVLQSILESVSDVTTSTFTMQNTHKYCIPAVHLPPTPAPLACTCNTIIYLKCHQQYLLTYRTRLVGREVGRAVGGFTSSMPHEANREVSRPKPRPLLIQAHALCTAHKATPAAVVTTSNATHTSPGGSEMKNFLLWSYSCLERHIQSLTYVKFSRAAAVSRMRKSRESQGMKVGLEIVEVVVVLVEGSE